MKEITILGGNQQTGAYLLRMDVAKDLSLAFGRFRQGRSYFVPSGGYVYVGSAMAKKGSMTLGRRLLRHACRQDRQRPQPILPGLLAALKEAGLGPPGMRAPSKKTLFWNIDYLLEDCHVTLSHVFMLRCASSLEDVLARFLMSQPGCFMPVEGLGANDKQGQTHLLGVMQIDNFWQRLPQALKAYLLSVSK